MKKSTNTPEPETPDQALEDGSVEALSLPAEPRKIFTALNEKSFLFHHSASNPDLRITTRDNLLFALWTFNTTESSPVGVWRGEIQCFPFNAYMTAKGTDVVVTEKNGGNNQIWTIRRSGSRFVTIESSVSRYVLAVDDSSTTDDTLVILRGGSHIPAEDFMIGINAVQP